ncbi:MAG: serine/threonine protein kinase, partial [Deltaproteobacteria bacterium]|nr:serine/threonine protein kinase [Nannocystaceae bacterium]
MASGEPARAQKAGANDPSVLLGLVIAERYRVDAVLGIGGMGAVLRCRHLGLDRDVAVKLLHPELAADAEIAARFDREARSASRLEHPNCVHVFDFGAWQPSGGGPVAKYLAMQLLSGCELADLLGQPLPPRRAIALVQQILAGLEHAHERGIVHRDLKPENVFVTTDPSGVEVLKLVDFGIAKITAGEGANAKLTRMGVVFGTPRYMSPEQAAGGVVDLRTDLYAVGVILFEMLSGLPPFLDDDAMALLRKHLFHDPPPLPDSVPPQLRAITFRLLHKERDGRFASAAQVSLALAELDAQLARGPVDALALSPTLASTSFEQRPQVTTVMPPRIDSVRIAAVRPG